MKNIPSCNLKVDHRLEGADLAEECATVCKELIPSWASSVHTGDSVEVSTISGGISNALYRISLSGSDELSVLPKRVVLRVYGDNTEKFVDREDEVATMELLHRHGFGPSVLGTFANGRIESFLELVCLNPDDISKAEYRGRIAQTLARFHRVSEHGGLRSSGEPMTPFKKTREWLETAKTLDFSDASGMKEKFEALNVDGVMAEVDIVASVAALCNSPVVFAHNDLLSGNIMVSEYNDRQMTFIDFEYADWAPRGFDLGNHFCEYAGFDGDYSKYPTDSSDFVTEYLTVFNGGRKPTEKEVVHAVLEANVFALAAHLYWAAWAILQAKWSSIDFDYIEYASLRLGEYYKRKNEFIDACKQEMQ